MTNTTDTPVVITLEQFPVLCQRLARRIVDSGEEFDVYLTLANGGLVPAGYMTKIFEPIFGKKPVLSLTMSNYTPEGIRLESPIILEAPPEVMYANKRVLILDDVWHSGKSLHLAKKMIARAGGTPFVAVLHFKPQQNEFPDDAPNFYVETAEEWIQYPWEDPTLLLHDVPSRIRTNP